MVYIVIVGVATVRVVRGNGWIFAVGKKMSVRLESLTYGR